MNIKLSLNNCCSILFLAKILIGMSCVAQQLTDEEIIYQSLGGTKPLATKAISAINSFNDEDDGPKPWNQEQLDDIKRSFKGFIGETVSSKKESNDEAIALWDIAEDVSEKPTDQISNVDSSNLNPYKETLKQVEKVTESTLEPYKNIISNYAKTYGIDPILISLIIRFESNFNEKAISYKGAKGLMQLMDSVSGQHNIDPYNPEENIKVGVYYFSTLMKKYNNDIKLALAAYNAGPGAVDKYSGVPPYKETQDYVAKILLSYEKLKRPKNEQIISKI